MKFVYIRFASKYTCFALNLKLIYIEADFFRCIALEPSYVVPQEGLQTFKT
jgi:hypothetical protein